MVEIASKCGLVLCLRLAERSRRPLTCGNWRKHDLQVAEKTLPESRSGGGLSKCRAAELPEPKIVEVSDRMAAYVRHTGYNRSIRNAWLILKAWANSEQRDFSSQFGLHHSIRLG